MGYDKPVLKKASNIVEADKKLFKKDMKEHEAMINKSIEGFGGKPKKKSYFKDWQKDQIILLLIWAAYILEKEKRLKIKYFLGCT